MDKIKMSQIVFSSIMDNRREIKPADTIEGNVRINNNPFNFITILLCDRGFVLFEINKFKEVDGNTIRFCATETDLLKIINNEIHPFGMSGLEKFNYDITAYLDFNKIDR